MFPTLSGVVFILLMVQFILGNFANAFIALVNCIGWMKREKLSSVDRILIALAISRIALLWVTLLYLCLPMNVPAVLTLNERIRAYNIWTIANHFSLWCDTLLSIFYLLRIANFSSLLFLHVKKRVKSVMMETVIGGCVILIFQLMVINIAESMPAHLHEANVTWKTHLRGTLHLYVLTLYTLASFIPFILSLLCFLLLTCSLCKHLKKMQLHGGGAHNSSIRVHIKAIQSVVCFLSSCVIYFVSLILYVWTSDSPLSEVTSMLFQAVGIIYPSIHTLILIWGNKKLKQTFLFILWQVRRWLNGQST